MFWSVRSAGRFAARAGHLLLPARCMCCGAEAAGSGFPWLCSACARQLEPLPDILRVGEAPPTRALWLYRGPARALVHRLKYDARTRLGTCLGHELAARTAGGTIDVVSAVPMHWRRRWRRGHDQAWTLARGFAASLGVPCLRLTYRARSTRPQVGLGGAARRSNLDAAFRLRRTARPLLGTRVALVDDVMTTGTTLARVAELIEQLGARTYGFVVAAAPTDR